MYNTAQPLRLCWFSKYNLLDIKTVVENTFFLWLYTLRVYHFYFNKDHREYQNKILSERIMGLIDVNSKWLH